MPQISQRGIDDIAFFLAFCVETYKNAHSITGDEAAKILIDSGAMDYLESNFEPIHTQAPQWILEEIEEYLSTANPQST